MKFSTQFGNKKSTTCKDFLDRLVQLNGSTDLKWVRFYWTKAYVLDISELKLITLNCARLLTLHQVVFPIDTNDGRIYARVGLIPLSSTEFLQLHLLKQYSLVIIFVFVIVRK